MARAGKVASPAPRTGAGGSRRLRARAPALKPTTANNGSSLNLVASPSPNPKARRRRKAPSPDLRPQPCARCQELPLAHREAGLPAPTCPSTGSSLPSLLPHKALQRMDTIDLEQLPVPLVDLPNGDIYCLKEEIQVAGCLVNFLPCKRSFRVTILYWG